MSRPSSKDNKSSIPNMFKSLWKRPENIQSTNAPYLLEGILPLDNNISDCPSSCDDEYLSKIDYSTFHPVNPNWIKELNDLMKKYFSEEIKFTIKIRALEIFYDIFLIHRLTHGQLLIDNVIIPTLIDLDGEKDHLVRSKGVQILIDLALNCTNSGTCLDLLSIVGKILNRPFEKLKCCKDDSSDTQFNEYSEDDFMDLKSAVLGLIKFFQKKLFEPPQGTVNEAFNLLVDHTKAYYTSDRPYSKSLTFIRKYIIEFLLNFRVNNLGFIGLLMQDDNRIRYSSFFICKSNNGESPSSTQTFSNNASPQQSSTLTSRVSYQSLSLDELFHITINVFKFERDYTILTLVFKKLPALLRSTALVRLTHKSEINVLIDMLVSMMNDPNLQDLINVPDKLLKTNYQVQIFPILSSLITYHKQIDISRKEILIKAFQHGATSRISPHESLKALSLCMIEMQTTMIKLLPNLIIELSKISATPDIAIPFLEFLSYLILVPKLYASFVPDQYISIFAIVLPYLNPSKFSDYIVAMAYRVISMWFLMSRLPFRTVFIEYLLKGFRANVIEPLKECKISSEENRKGSFHYDINSKSSEVQTTHISSTTNSNTVELSHSNKNFHNELLQSYIDLLSRYTSGLCSSTPDSYKSQDVLLDRSHSSWIVGNRLITISTSGCRSRVFLDGLCERCYRLAKSGVGNSIDSSNEEVSVFRPLNPSDDAEFYSNEISSDDRIYPSRRRHQSAITPNLSHTLTKPASRAFDDFHLNSSSSCFDDSDEVNTCGNWCEGWAEITIRRASGTTSWKMRLQNKLNVSDHNSPYCFFPDLTSMYPSRSSEVELLLDNTIVKGEDPLIDSNSEQKVTSNSPVFRRISSSPEMERDDAFSLSKFKDIEESTKCISIETENNLKVSRASSFGRGDCSKSATFTRSSPLNWKSPTSRYRKQENNGAPENNNKKETFTKHDFRLDIKPDHSIDNSGNQSPSSLKSNVISSARTPPKTPSKLENISEVLNTPQRGRLATISVMTPATFGSHQPNVSSSSNRRGSLNQRVTEISNPRNDGIRPSYLFLQLFYDPAICEDFKQEIPILLPRSTAIKNSIDNLDRILPHEFHKIGVIYVNKNQGADSKDVLAILSNRYGSLRYINFISGLGTLIKLSDVDQSKCYIGGLSLKGEDGNFAYHWQDNLTQVIFHVATLMPNIDNDPNRQKKIAHIGNDCVCIIYNDSGENLNISYFKFGSFLVAAIVVTPLDNDINSVSVELFDENFREIIAPREAVTLSDSNLSCYVRQLGINLNIASLIFHSQKSVESRTPYIPNLVERFKQIYRIKQRAKEGNEKEAARRFPSNFATHANSRSATPLQDNDESSSSSNNCDKLPYDFSQYI